MQEQLIFTQAVEGLTRALGDKLDAPTARQLQEIGIDVYKKLEPAYPQAIWARAIELGARVLCPGKPMEQAMFELGRRFIEGYEETPLGRNTLQLARVLGPRKALQRMAESFRQANNYTEVRLVELGPGRFDLWLSKVLTVEFIRGMVVAGLELTGAVSPTVETTSHDLEGTTYRIGWDEL